VVLLFVDLDGVVYRGKDPVPGVAAVLADRAAKGDDVVYVTNLATSHRTDYLAKLQGMGAPVSPDRIMSSARATALYLSHADPPVHRVLVVGAPGLGRELAEVGLEVTFSGERAELLAERQAAAAKGGPRVDEAEVTGQPDAVVVALDPEFTYGRLAEASMSIRNGARFIATNRDPALPTEGSFRPGAGSIVAAVETASGVKAISMGKPEPEVLEVAAQSVGRHAIDGIMIGDALSTDIAAAKAAGARSILMLTGVTTRAQYDALVGNARPDEVAEDAAALAAVLDRLAAE
jgi:4-nitrophenyl phosphatase